MFLQRRFITVKAMGHRAVIRMTGDKSDIAMSQRDQMTGIDVPAYACLAVAGPIEGGVVKMTNLDWCISIEDMRVELNMKSLYVINDFAALAYATPFLKDNEILSLQSGKAAPEAAMVVLGPGTGFGMAALVPDGDDWKILPTEGGHCSFAPTNDKELAIRAFAARTLNHVSIEDLISGRGLVMIYKALCAIAGEPAADFSPADVSTKGMNNEDARCHEALETFCLMLGSIAGDKALSLGAKGGVFLGGGIIPKIADFISKTAFLERFTHKGPMTNYVKVIPVGMIINDKAALVGTAAWLVNHTQELRESYFG